MPTMICQKCGKECERTSNVQKYCPECRKKKQVERNATYQQKRETTPDLVVAVGSQTICPNCKKLFLKKSGNQIFCEDCSAEHLQQQKKQKRTEMSNVERSEVYRKTTENNNNIYDRFSLYVPKGKKAYLQEISKSMGISLNTFINQAIEQYEQLILSQKEENE